MSSAPGRRSTEPRFRILMLPPKASGLARYTAIMLWSISAALPACRLRTILVSVSPWETVYVPPLKPAALLGAALPGAAEALLEELREGPREARTGALEELCAPFPAEALACGAALGAVVAG